MNASSSRMVVVTDYKNIHADVTLLRLDLIFR
jgi:hypothetical protein